MGSEKQHGTSGQRSTAATATATATAAAGRMGRDGATTTEPAIRSKPAAEGRGRRRAILGEEWLYCYEERLGIMCGSKEPTTEQKTIARKIADEQTREI